MRFDFYEGFRCRRDRVIDSFFIMSFFIKRNPKTIEVGSEQILFVCFFSVTKCFQIYNYNEIEYYIKGSIERIEIVFRFIDIKKII